VCARAQCNPLTRPGASALSGDGSTARRALAARAPRRAPAVASLVCAPSQQGGRGGSTGWAEGAEGWPSWPSCPLDRLRPLPAWNCRNASYANPCPHKAGARGLFGQHYGKRNDSASARASAREAVHGEGFGAINARWPLFHETLFHEITSEHSQAFASFAPAPTGSPRCEP